MSAFISLYMARYLLFPSLTLLTYMYLVDGVSISVCLIVSLFPPQPPCFSRRYIQTFLPYHTAMPVLAFRATSSPYLPFTPSTHLPPSPILILPPIHCWPVPPPHSTFLPLLPSAQADQGWPSQRSALIIPPGPGRPEPAVWSPGVGR